MPDPIDAGRPAAPADASSQSVAASGGPSDALRCFRGLSPAIAGIYAIGVVLMLGRLIVAICGGWRLRGSAGLDSRWADRGAGGARGAPAGLAPRPRSGVLRARVPAPVVLGLARPIILLPAALATGLTPDELEAVLTHELAGSAATING